MVLLLQEWFAGYIKKQREIEAQKIAEFKAGMVDKLFQKNEAAGLSRPEVVKIVAELEQDYWEVRS